MNYSIKADGIFSECLLTEEEVCFNSSSTSVHIRIEDIIGCEEVTSYFFYRQYSMYLWYIQQEGIKLTKAAVHISGDENICEKLRTNIQYKLTNLSKRPKSLLVLINPIGGNQTALTNYKTTVEPIFNLAAIKCDVIVSERHRHMVDVVKDYDFKGIDGIVILGGDGSYSEVVNVLIRKEQKKAGIDYNDPTAKIRPITLPIGLIPTGTGNFIVGGSVGCKDVLNSTLHVIKGNVFLRNTVGTYADNKLVNYAGIGSSYGAFTDMIYHSDTKFRWFGRLRYYVFPLWSSLVKSFIRIINAEITFYTNVTEAEENLNQNIGQNEVLVEEKALRGVTSSSSKAVVLDGKFTCISVVNGNLYDDKKMDLAWSDSAKLPGHVFSSIVFDESLTELQLIRFLKEGIDQKKTRTGNFYNVINARGIKVKLREDKDDLGSENYILKHLIHIDGELHEIVNLEIQYWLHQKIVPLYTSYL